MHVRFPYAQFLVSHKNILKGSRITPSLPCPQSRISQSRNHIFTILGHTWGPPFGETSTQIYGFNNDSIINNNDPFFLISRLYDSLTILNAVYASAVENWSTTLRGPSAAKARWLFLLTFFFFFYTMLTSTERGASAVVNLVSPRYWERQHRICSDMWNLGKCFKFSLTQKNVYSKLRWCQICQIYLKQTDDK